ncbi:hypothetical protein QY97_02446 [Bacillus thermotolerans]|nr:hypothetical protein QY97_02446 [Bacillus thermotolerans]
MGKCCCTYRTTLQTTILLNANDKKREERVPASLFFAF